MPETAAVPCIPRVAPGSGAETRAVRTGIAIDGQHGAVIPPIYLSSTYAFAGFKDKRAYDYTRTANPTRDVLGLALAELEEGAGAVVTSTGLSAVLLVVQLLRPEDRLVAPHDCYGGTRRLLDSLAERGHFQVEYIDESQPEALTEALSRPTRMLWVETPSNPLLRITDLRLAKTLATRANALLVVDNTFLSPALQRPLTLGADIVVHSTTKYLNGHSDVVGGAVVAREQALAEQLAWWANVIGVTGAPFDSYLTLRGLRTLHPRIRTHLENAAAVAELLAGASGRSPGALSRPGRSSGTRGGRPSADRIRRDGELRAGGWRVGGGGIPRRPALLHAGRIARRGGVAGRPSRDHDPRLDDAGAAGRGGNHRGAAPALGRASRAVTICWRILRRP